MKRIGYGLSDIKKFIKSKINDDKMSVEEGLEALKGTVMNLNKYTDSDNNLDLIESFNTEFKNSGSSLKSKDNKRDFDYDGLEQFKKILFYSVYEKLINKFNSDISEKKNREPIDNSDISEKKKAHTIKLIKYMNYKKRQAERSPVLIKLDEKDILKSTPRPTCIDEDNSICEIKLFGLDNFVIEFDNKDIVPLIKYVNPSADDETNEP